MSVQALKFYQELKKAKDQDQKDQLIANAIEDIQNDNDLSQLKKDVTEIKSDVTTLKKDVLIIRESIRDLEIRFLREITSQTWKYLGGLTLIGIIFKIAEMILFKIQ